MDGLGEELFAGSALPENQDVFLRGGIVAGQLYRLGDGAGVAENIRKLILGGIRGFACGRCRLVEGMDGGLSYCISEMAVLAEQNMDVKVVVLNNSILGWIKWYEAANWDGRFTEVDTKTIDFAMVSRGLNCAGVSIHDPQTLREELKAALSIEGPALIDIATVETEACKFTDDPKAVGYIREDARRKAGK